MKEFKNLTKDLYELQIDNEFDLRISKKYQYKKCPEEKIKVTGFGYYDTDEPKRKNNNHRYYLELEIKGITNTNTLTAIMMNPSNTFPNSKNKKSTIDSTVKNVIRMAYLLKYSKIIVLNSFALIDGDGKNTHSDNSQKKNLAIIEAYIKENKNSDYLLAWGNNAEDTDKICKYLKDNIDKNKIFVYKKNKNGNPCHPGIRVENLYKCVSEFLEESKFIEYEI